LLDTTDKLPHMKTHMEM